eukprot:gene9819-18392_t
MDWSKVEGAHSKKRVVILRETKDKTFRCPVEFCENRTFFSKRGYRKHIDTKHRWYYFFDEKPSDKVIERSAEQSTQRSHKHIESARRCVDTTKRPHFSISEGVGKQYVDWLCAVCGGGLSAAQATQNATRVMKFLKFCSEDDEDNLTEQLVDYSIGSAGLICSFIEHIGKEWGLGSSAQFGYLQAITDLIDFRKSSGLSTTVLGNLAVSEVYINRGKKALAKRKIREWSKNLSIEVLSGCNQWATMEEMERVIPYHLPRYKDVLTNCKGYPLTAITPADLTFATRLYQKRNSREIAVNAKSAMKKLQNKEVDRSLKRIILDNKNSSDQDCCLEETEQHQPITPGRNGKETICVNLDKAGNESCRAYSPPDCNADKLKAKPVVSRRVPFTPEEDFFSKKKFESLWIWKVDGYA